jgi:hypothetical protein
MSLMEVFVDVENLTYLAVFVYLLPCSKQD